MGGVKDLNLDAVAGDEFDGWSVDDTELTEGEVFNLQLQTIKAELQTLSERLMKHSDRMRYYGEVVDWEEIDFLRREVDRIMTTLT